MRRIVGLLVLIALVAACTPEAEPPPDVITSAEPSPVEPSTTEPGMAPSPDLTLEPTESCDGLGRPPSGGEVTFVRGSKLLGIRPDGSRKRCLADLRDLRRGLYAYWNAPGDRVLIDGPEIALSQDLESTPPLVDRPLWESPVWSRPTGTSVVYITKDGHLEKRPSFGGPPTDISFLDRHEAVAYHPAGTHIVVSGRKADEEGLFLATNVGTKPQLLARGEDTPSIHGMEFSHDGRSLYFLASHDHSKHLHRLSLEPNGARRGTVRELGLETLARSRADITPPTISPWSGQVAWAEGECSSGIPASLQIPGNDRLIVTPELRTLSLGPVGWLPNGNLVVVAYTPGHCGTTSDGTWVLSDREPRRIIGLLDIAPVLRVPLPPPPPPPDDEQAVVA